MKTDGIEKQQGESSMSSSVSRAISPEHFPPSYVARNDSPKKLIQKLVRSIDYALNQGINITMDARSREIINGYYEGHALVQDQKYFGSDIDNVPELNQKYRVDLGFKLPLNELRVDTSSHIQDLFSTYPGNISVEGLPISDIRTFIFMLHQLDPALCKMMIDNQITHVHGSHSPALSTTLRHGLLSQNMQEAYLGSQPMTGESLAFNGHQYGYGFPDVICCSPLYDFREFGMYQKKGRKNNIIEIDHEILTIEEEVNRMLGSNSYYKGSNAHLKLSRKMDALRQIKDRLLSPNLDTIEREQLVENFPVTYLLKRDITKRPNTQISDGISDVGEEVVVKDRIWPSEIGIILVPKKYLNQCRQAMLEFYQKQPGSNYIPVMPREAFFKTSRIVPSS